MNEDRLVRLLLENAWARPLPRNTKPKPGALWANTHLQRTYERLVPQAKPLWKIVPKVVPKTAGVSQGEIGKKKWCKEDIAKLKKESFVAKRDLKYLRQRKKRWNPEDDEKAQNRVQLAKQRLKEARKSLKCEKRGCASSDVDSEDGDYERILLRPRTRPPPVTEALQPEVVARIFCALFPQPKINNWKVIRVNNDLPLLRMAVVTIEEMMDCFQGGDITHPGPDMIPKSFMAVAARVNGPEFAKVYTVCLRSGIFPRPWKRSRLVLTKVKNGPDDDPSLYSSMCWTNEVGKLLEEIISRRLEKILDNRWGTGIAVNQFGFRRGRGIVDVWKDLWCRVTNIRDRGEVALVIRIEIRNPFNTLTWPVIDAALQAKEIPKQMLQILRDYLQGRVIEYIDSVGRKVTHEVRGGIPKGLVLGKTLWNVTYDQVMRLELPAGGHLMGYEDKTIIIAQGSDRSEAIKNAELALGIVIPKIEALGLKVDKEKTESVVFEGGASQSDEENTFLVADERINITKKLELCGVTIDGNWIFNRAFEASLTRARVPGAVPAATYQEPRISHASWATYQEPRISHASWATYQEPRSSHVSWATYQGFRPYSSQGQGHFYY